jgi:vanillate O-demethylase monooxygenase subunit
MMYPFRDHQTFVRNRWYVLGFSREFSRNPVERTILETPLAIYRTQSGKPVAMYGICPHRYYPLALGHLDGDALVCGYHGYTFDADGKCIRVPSQGTGAGHCQPTYRVEERGPLLWIWMGDEAKCDPATIPPYEDFGLEQPGWTHCAECYFHIDGRAQLLIDNLMDLTHIAFLHGQIDLGAAFLQKGLEGEERDRSFQLRRVLETPWTQFHEFLFKPEAKFSGMSQMASITDFYGPELIRTSGPVTYSIDGMDTVPDEIGYSFFMHGITPETATTTHYFGFITRNFRLEDSEFDDALRRATTGVRQQDVDAIDAVEPRLAQSVARQRELLSRADWPAVKVRQKIQAMLDAEDGGGNIDSPAAARAVSTNV